MRLSKCVMHHVNSRKAFEAALEAGGDDLILSDNSLPGYSGVAALKALADPTRKDNGNLRFDVYQQKTRPNHFTVIEVWRNQKAVDGHEIGTHTKDFRKVLGSATGALYDQRWYKAL